MPGAVENPVPLWSERSMRFFNVAFTRSFAKSFSALRMPHWGMQAAPPGRAIVVYATHPGWWDAVLFMLLLRHFHPGRPAFLPMDAQALRKYPFMKRLGVFPVEQNSPRGAVAFLQVARMVLQGDAHMLWMNAPGRFADVRERPVPIAAGTVRLPEIAPHAVFVPLAFEYVQWTEKRGEALAAFGPPIEGATLAAMDREARHAALREAQTALMDRLAADAITRDPERFQVIVSGGAGMGGIYGAWQYMKAMTRGQRHVPHHDPRAGRTG